MAIRFQVGLSGLPKQFMIFRSLQLFWWIERWILVNPDTQRMRIRENSPYKTGVYGINVGRSWPKNGNHTGVVSSGICEVVGAEVVSSFLSIFSSIIAPDHLPTKNRGPSGPNQRERMKILPTSKKSNCIFKWSMFHSGRLSQVKWMVYCNQALLKGKKWLEIWLKHLAYIGPMISMSMIPN